MQTLRLFCAVYEYLTSYAHVTCMRLAFATKLPIRKAELLRGSARLSSHYLIAMYGCFASALLESACRSRACNMSSLRTV